MNPNLKKKILIGLCVAIFLIGWWGIYIPYSLNAMPQITYGIQKGLGYKAIGIYLERQGIIKNHGFFTLYVLISGNYSKLQAGSYKVSPSMSVADIVKKIATGDVIKNKITIIEGWDLEDIGKYLETQKLYAKPAFAQGSSEPSEAKKDFLDLTKKDFSGSFDFLKDKPKNLSLEGYIFPDTYEVLPEEKPEELLKNTLANFDKKLTTDLRQEIANQKKSIFQIITMASILEKEVKSLEDKKIVSGILWKRLESGIPLQVDATINYITDKNDSRVQIKDTKIDSPYNTYKYGGLPLGPICNPGMNSILAAIYPAESPYWYYLSANGSGKTIFSKTLEEHNIAVVKYLK
jgi:UPF0755 protein